MQGVTGFLNMQKGELCKDVPVFTVPFTTMKLKTLETLKKCLLRLKTGSDGYFFFSYIPDIPDFKISCQIILDSPGILMKTKTNNKENVINDR